LDLASDSMSKGQFPSPGDDHGLFGTQHKAHEGTQGLRPCHRLPEGRGGLVIGSHPLTHLATAGKEIRHCWGVASGQFNVHRGTQGTLLAFV
jgi:hypothetical protein